MQILNDSPRGDELTIERTGDVVAHGASVEVPDELGQQLLLQGDDWKAADANSAQKDDKSEEKA